MSSINVLVVGDIVGRPGRRIVRDKLQDIVKTHSVDMVIANGENAAHGKGITPEITHELFSYGISVITTGNHIWNNKSILSILGSEDRLLRPANYPPGVEGYGHCIIRVRDQRVCVVNLLGRIYMSPVDCPFRKFDEIYNRLKNDTKIFIVDFHAEATSEKRAFGWYVDGRASACFGTHTHIQTADEVIQPHGTGYITDIGMSGSMNSVIGMNKDVSIHNFLMQTRASHEVATGEAMICGAVFTITAEGKTTKVERVNHR